MLIMAHVFNFLIKKSKASLLFADKNKLPRRKQRGIRKALTAGPHRVYDMCPLAV